MPSDRIQATGVRFIKLGKGGEWERECIEGESSCIRLGFISHQHSECLAGNWRAVSDYWSAAGRKVPGKATEIANQVKTFYTADEQTLWITFHKRKLYWCFASSKVEELSDGTRVRPTINRWSSQDVSGRELYVDDLSGALTKVQGFRGTICAVDNADDLLKRLNGEVPEDVVHALNSLDQFERSLAPLLWRLGWKDFELLCDLIFTRAGWQRISSLGKTQKTIDLELISPVSGKRAAVQVKSQADLDEFLQYQTTFQSMDQYAELYFAVHKPTKALAEYQPESRIVLLTTDRLAKLVASCGLAPWLIKKVS